MKSKALGVVLKRYCRRNGIETREIATRLNLDSSNFSKAISGRRDLPDECMDELAKITGYDIKYLRYLSGQVPEPPIPCTEEVFLAAYDEFNKVLNQQALF